MVGKEGVWLSSQEGIVDGGDRYRNDEEREKRKRKRRRRSTSRKPEGTEGRGPRRQSVVHSSSGDGRDRAW